MLSSSSVVDVVGLNGMFGSPTVNEIVELRISNSIHLSVDVNLILSHLFNQLYISVLHQIEQSGSLFKAFVGTIVVAMGIVKPTSPVVVLTNVKCPLRRVTLKYFG